MPFDPGNAAAERWTPMAVSNRVLFALLWLWLPIETFAQTQPQPQPLSIEGAITYVYKSIKGSDLRLHVFNPPSPRAARQSAIVFFFGGGWTQGLVTQFVPQSTHLARRGMVAIVADYRVSGRHQTSPFEAIADAKSAMRWLRSRAGELGIDPDRIVASGGSAGGHLALSSAVFETFNEPGEDRRVSAKPNALLLFNPAVDTSQISRFGSRGQEASPIHHIGRSLPPTVIFHGKADAIVPYADVDRFCIRAKLLGARCDLFGYEGATHGFFNQGRDNGKWYQETLMEADRFLTGIKYLPESPKR